MHTTFNIVGAGPFGLAMSVQAERRQLDREIDLVTAHRSNAAVAHYREWPASIRVIDGIVLILVVASCSPWL
jgi:thioredoxin reductase